MDLKNPGTSLSLMLTEIRSGTLPKTLLIEGKDESSRKEAANICAAALMCTADEVPCLECDSCLKVLSGRHPDVTVLFPGEEKVSVDDIRKVRLDAGISPFEAECKIVIFHQAHNLNVQSQNALLKILEEPPKSVYFILTAPSSKLMLQTVDSRCAKFSLGSLSEKDVYGSLKEFCTNITDSDLSRLCCAVLYLDGFVPNEKNVRDLLSAMEVCDTFYTSGRFPFEKLPSKKEDSDMLSVILKTAALYAMTVFKAKKGVMPKNGGILGADRLEAAMARFPARAAFSQYGLFCELYERLSENANVGAVISSLRACIYD